MINFYGSKSTNGDQSKLLLSPANDEHLDVSMLETWLWDAACAIRGATDAPKFKDL
jgi:type I restriction enzyme M protein